MSQALNHIAQAVEHIEASSLQASRTMRVALAFGIVAVGYGLVVASGVVGG
ncbi:hypothetical protein [Caballeronia novacaledonica]|jgi:hypothetical protein|uniref:Uncharacterized protein n=1 Tax=Caballeronia novacaledonica TaxID=1544861 RepID=A0AA37I5W4_9BURK|nr:hypothetical protein [Caballeronia novacaledonica]GJH23378.1 hypothetical protein CBA19CS42_02700 [Caballeronia novacaledonica]